MKSFFQFAQEREAIRKRRESGDRPPWTDDPLLRDYFYCNVFREDDKVTRWFAEAIRNHVCEDSPASLLACAVFRFVNYIPSGVLIEDMLRIGEWDRDEFIARLLPVRERGEQIVGGAYLIKTPPGMNKIYGIAEIIDNLWALRHHLLRYNSLEHMHGALTQIPYVGKFMAYEIVTDLRHTCVLDQAPDIMTWASPGPGCARGLGWVYVADPSKWSYNSHVDRVYMLPLMRELLEESASYQWDRPWEMREVEHVLCEYAKYRAAGAGHKVKRRFSR